MDLHPSIAGHRLARAVLAMSLVLAVPGVATADSLKDINFNGVNQTAACDCAPPDTHGAVGNTQYVQIVNSWVRVYNKTPKPGTSTPTLLRDQSLASFFQYSSTMIFDPRVVYDSVAQRWIITAEARPFSATVQWHFIAVSSTNDATGKFVFHRINVDFLLNNYFWDFPQLGLSEKAVIITANIFDHPPPNETFLHSDVISISKSQLYNGVLSFQLFRGLHAFTLAPPIVVGPNPNPNTYLISAASSGSALNLYYIQNAGSGTESIVGPFGMVVNPYIPPRTARQPGTSATLDASDSRFINASLQKGNALWQIHTIGNGGYVTAKFYLIDLVQKNVAWTDLFFASATSDDFNASITANPAGQRFITWTSTDAPANIQAQARYIGTGVLGPPAFNGKAAYTSPTFYGTAGTQRWGDYSAFTVDPADTSRAWATNEIVNTQTTWGSRIFNIGIP